MPNQSGGFKDLTSDARWIVVALYILAFFTFGLTVARYLNSPLRFDEVEWPTQAKGILQHGVPKVLYSEERTLYTKSYYGYDAHYGMWHPPLYLYSLAGSAALFGIGNRQMRAVGLVWFALSLWLVWRISQELVDGPHSKLASRISVALAALSPLLAEGSLYLDIDNTSLAFSMLLFAWVFLKFPEEKSLKRSLLLTLIFAFSLWSKLTTPFIMLASMVVYHFLNKNFKTGIFQGLIIGGFGAGVFLLTYWIYCSLLNYPSWFMFEISYWGKRGMYTSPQTLKAILHALRWNFVWISPPIAIMLATLYSLRSWNYVCCRKLDKADFLVIFSMAGLAIYTIWGGLWGKYTFGPVLVGVTAIGNQLSISLRSIRIVHRTILVTLLLLLVGVHLLVLPALQVRVPGFDLRSTGLWDAISDVRNLYLLITVGAFAVFYVIARPLVSGGKKETALLITLSLYLLAANPVNAMKLVLSPEDRSPYHPFQERGFIQTVQFLNDNLGSDHIILSPKDIGFYFHGKHYSTEAVLAFDGLFGLEQLASSNRVHYIVDSEQYPTLPDRDRFFTMSSFSPKRRIGDFVIYRNLAVRH